MKRSADSLRGSAWFLAYLSALVALSPMSMDTYMPAIPSMAAYFSVPIAEINLTLSTYVMGAGLGQFLGGALSDHLGRKTVAVSGLVVFTLASLLIALSESVQGVQLLRFVQALGGGFTIVNCIAQVRDIYPANEVAKRFAGVMLVVLIAPMIAPLLGAVLMRWGWQAIFFMLAGYGLVCLLIFVLLIPETRRGPRVKPTAESMLRNYIAVLQHRVDGHRVAWSYTAFCAFSSAVFMCYLTTAATIYMRHFQRDEYEFSLMFGAGALALAAGNRLAVVLMARRTTRQILSYFNAGHMLVAAALVLVSVTGLGSVWLVFALMLALLAMGAGIAPTVSGVFVSFFDELSGSAASLNTTIMMLVGALIGALAAMLAVDSISPIFVVMLCSAVAARLVLWRMPELNPSTA